MPSRLPRFSHITSQLCSSCLHKSLLRTFSSTSTRQSPSSSPLPSHDEISSARTYCVNLLRKYDNPSLIISAFIPPTSKDAYLSLRAFNIDIAQIPDIVSHPTVGAMRMQFWRDTVARVFQNNPPKEPVAILLWHSLSTLSTLTNKPIANTLPKPWLNRIITARESHLMPRPYPTLADLESYAESTYSTLLYLTLASLPMSSITADHIASHIGKASGIAAVLRGVPLLAFPPPPNHHSNTSEISGVLAGGGGGGGGGSGPSSTRQRQASVPLPLDVMLEAGVKEEEVFRHGADAPGLRDAVFTVATRASDHLITARVMLENLQHGRDVGHAFEHELDEGHDYSPHDTANAGNNKSPPYINETTPVIRGKEEEKEEEKASSTNRNNELRDAQKAFGVFMPAISTRLWLERLQKVDFDIFRPELRTQDWRLPWKAWWAYRRKTL